ncbi:protocadherin Fat 4-like [Anopheles aquasalis]|uniref:protocadherin Fat 4-like n=1 Tax=Anopheles aquasalis TaxID=42839 RepID=UPI00215B1A4D|nr:protocadherin Fat 4-like [Anopheles aquasalis]
MEIGLSHSVAKKRCRLPGLWPLSVLLLCVLLCSSAEAQDCASPILTFSGFFPAGEDISTTVGAGYTLGSYDVSNIRSVDVKPSADGWPVYIDAMVTAGKLTITTNDNFAIYEQLSNYTFFINKIVFVCASATTREMSFRQNIKEENNYPPRFSQDAYIVQLPLPLPKDFDIQLFIADGKGIVAYDMDLTKNSLTFSIDENEYFNVASASGATRTEFIAQLKTKETLTRIQQPIVLRITAQDEWNPPKTGQATVTISSDPENVFLVAPEFEQSLYNVKYKRGDQFTPIRIVLRAGSYDSSVRYELSGDNSALFTINPSADRSSATVALRSGVQIGEDIGVLLVTVAASRTGAEGTGQTALVVELTSDPKVLPEFEQSFYSGTIGKDTRIQLDVPIRIVPSTSDPSVRVTLAGDDASYFSATFSNNQVTVAPSSALSAEILKQKSYFMVKIQAEKTSVGLGETLLLLSVEKDGTEDPRFENLAYQGTLNVATNTLQIPTVRIAAGSYVTGLQFSYTGDVTFFNIRETAGTVSFSLNNVTPERLADRSYLLVTVACKLQDIEVAHAVVIVRVVRPPAPKFVKNFIEGQLDQRTLSLSMEKVEFQLDSFSRDTVVRLAEDDRGFFGIIQILPENVFEINLQGTVTRESLRGLSRLLLTVEATNPGTEKSFCVIAVNVIQPPQPAFERLLYDGMIEESTGQLIEPIVIKLTPETVDETVRFSLTGDDASYFMLETLTPIREGSRITLAAPLSDDLITSRELFQFNVLATEQLSSKETKIPVVVYVKRPFVKYPRFTKPLYKSRIGTNLQLVPFEEIILESGSYVESATVSILNSNTDLFSVRLRDGKVTVELLRPIIMTTISELDRFEFVVECNNPGMASGFTTIIIDIDRGARPEFEELYYTGELREGTKDITFSTSVALKAGTFESSTQYRLEGVDGGLVRYTVAANGRLSLYLLDEVSAEQLKPRSELQFLVVATNPTSILSQSHPSIAPCSVKIVRTVKPIFNRNSFRGKLVEGEPPYVEFTDDAVKLEIGTILESTMLTVMEAASTSSYFDATFAEDRETVRITLKSGVKWEQIRARVYFALTLQATNPGAEPTECSLVLDVVNLPAVTPAFSKSIYRGSLQEGTREVMFSAADTITVDPATILPTFQYAAIENDANLFELVLTEDKKFRVLLRDSISPSAIEGRDLLNFIISINNAYSAVDTATIVITIKLDDIISPMFTKLLYNGSVDVPNRQLLLAEPILLNAGTFTENTELGVGGTDAAMFTVARDGARVELGLKDTELEEGLHYISAYIQATNPGSDTATAFILLDVTGSQLPQFVQSAVYGYLAAGSRSVQFPTGSELKIVLSSTAPGFQWNLEDDDYRLFDGLLNDDTFTFKLKDSVTDEQLATKAQFSFSVTLKNPASGTVVSRVIIDRKLPTPAFSRTMYGGYFTPELQPRLTETISITEESFSERIVVRIKDSNVDFLTVEQSGRNVQLRVSRPVTISDFQGLEFVHVRLEANVDEERGEECSILLTLPEGTPCTPLPPIVDCTGCYNCSTGNVLSDVPVFEYGNYRFELRSDTIGTIGSVRALVKDPTALVEHQLEVQDAYLQLYLSMSPEGTLTLARPIEPKVYEFTVRAINVMAGKQTSVRVILDVLSSYECTELGRKVQNVEKSLLIVHLDEGRSHLTIFPTVLGSCEYVILSQSPASDPSYFDIDTESHWLVSRSFDREDQGLFGGMQVPQFQLRLKLLCSDGRAAGQQRTKRSLIDTNTINYASDITVINVVVDDINDNDPIFVNPTAGGMATVYLAYPHPVLAGKLMLPYLAILEASDADEGLNAKIRYSLEENDHFGVDPQTGWIHPATNSLLEENHIELTAIATDRDGASDGRSTRLTLSVQRSEESQIVVITLDAMDESMVAETIDRINRQSNFHLKLLHQAYVPVSSSVSRLDSKLQQQRTMRLVVYAMDDNNQLLEFDAIQSTILRAVPSIGASSIVTINEAICSANGSQCADSLRDQSTRDGLIASTSVLGALLLISLAVVSFLYIRYVRPLSKGATSASDDVEQLENDFDPSPPPTPPSLGGKKETSEARDERHEHDRKISINITGITMQDSEDTLTDSNRLARTLGDRLDEEDEYGGTTAVPEVTSEPKNVKFNELVERIEVAHDHSDDEEESVFEERL